MTVVVVVVIRVERTDDVIGAVEVVDVRTGVEVRVADDDCTPVGAT